MNLPGYDEWKLRTPDDDADGPEEFPEGCSCARRRDPWCRVHGKDPDQVYDEWRDAQMEKWL